MEFIGSIVNLVVVFGAIFFARDWLIELRSDVSATRSDVQSTSKEVNELDAEVSRQAQEHHETLSELLSEMRELRADVEGDEDVPSTKTTPALSELLVEVRELRELVKDMARFNISTGNLIKGLVIQSQSK